VKGTVKALLALLLIAVALGALGFVGYAPRVSSTVARARAARQLAMVLEPGERLEATTPAVRRPLWRYFHPISGVLAATDRRLIWVGSIPRALIDWSEAGPPIYEISAWTYDSAIVAPTRVHLGVSPGLAVRAAAGAPVMRFGVRTIDVESRRRVVNTLERRQAAVRAAAEREREEQERAAFLARQPVYHTVAPGDAVSSIAARYGITPDSLRAWNGLTSDRIRAGQRLLVKPGS
jgi:hypothetical protein